VLAAANHGTLSALRHFVVGFVMPICTWKLMLRRANQVGYHYLTTEQKGWPPSVGEEAKLVVEGRTVKWTIVEIFKDRSIRTDAFTVRVDETTEESRSDELAT
jgi:hypothetical protein